MHQEKSSIRKEAEKLEEEIAESILNSFNQQKNSSSTHKNINSSKTYSDKLNSLKPISPIKNYILVISLVISFGSSGYYQCMPNILGIPMTREVYGLNERDQIKSTGLFYSFLAIGSILACISVSLFVKHIGRVKTFLLIEVLKIITAGLFTIKSLELFTGLMMLTGFLAGIQETVIMVILRELLPPKISDKSGFLYYIMASSFNLLASSTTILVGGEMGLAKHWRVALSWPALISLSAIFGVLSTIGFSETPEYYIESGGELWKLKNQIFKTMSKIYTKGSTEKFIKIRFNELKKHRLFIKRQRLMAEKNLNFTKKAKKSKNVSSETMGWSNMFSKRYRLQLFVGLMLILLREINGNNILFFFSNQIFDEVIGEGKVVTLFISLGYFSGAILSYCSINFGRRTGLLVTTSIHFSCMILIINGIKMKNLWMISLCCYILLVSYTCGVGAILIVYLVDILPPFGMGMSCLLQWIAFTGLTMYAPMLIKDYGITLVLSFCVGICVLMFTFIVVFCFETKGMSKEEIEILFNRGNIICMGCRKGLDQRSGTLQEIIKSSQLSKEGLEVDIKISIRNQGTRIEQIETHRSVKKELLEGGVGGERFMDFSQQRRMKRRKSVGKL